MSEAAHPKVPIFLLPNGKTHTNSEVLFVQLHRMQCDRDMKLYQLFTVKQALVSFRTSHLVHNKLNDAFWNLKSTCLRLGVHRCS